MGMYSGIVPYMNQRGPAAGNLLSDNPNPPLDPGSISFPLGGNLVFRWLESLDALGNNEVDASLEYNYGDPIYLYAHERWEIFLDDRHTQILSISKVNPASPTFPAVPDRATLFSTPAVNHNTAKVLSDNSYWYYNGSIWVRYVPKVLQGTTTVFGDQFQIYTATVPQADIPKVQNGLQPSAYYDLCWSNNSRHFPNYDASFYLLPVGHRIYDEIPDRTELNSRVAGEKALFEDEFLTASQIEAGTNITLKWRTIAGVLTGYTTDPTKGGNLVIESTGGGGQTWHQGSKANGSIYYDAITNIIRFQDFPRLHEEPIDGVIAIEFQITAAPDNVGLVKAYGVNNNLYVSRGQGPDPGTIHTYPMYDAGFIDDQTVNHLRFRDTATVQWDLLGTRMPTQTENGIIYRKGVVVRANAIGVYSGWYLQETNTSPIPSAEFIDSNEVVQVEGKFGVVCTITLPNATTTKLNISRPLVLKHDAIPVPIFGLPANPIDPNTGLPHIENPALSNDPVFDAAKGTIDISFKRGKWTGFPNYTNKKINDQQGVMPRYFLNNHLELDNIPFHVEDYGNGRRGVWAFTTRKSTVFQSQWAIDYDALGGDGRTLGFYGGGIRNQLLLGGLGLFADSAATQNIPGCRVDYLVVDGYPDNDFNRWGQRRLARLNSSNFSTDGFNTLYSNAIQPENMGLYQVTYRIQGLMTIPINTVLNAVIHPRIHSFFTYVAMGGGSLVRSGLPDLGEHFSPGVAAVGGMWSLSDYIPQVGTPLQASNNYAQVINSRPWEISGSALIPLDSTNTIGPVVLRYNPGTGENRFGFQVCYMYFSIDKVADHRDFEFGDWRMPSKNTKIHAEIDALSSNYNFTNF